MRIQSLDLWWVGVCMQAGKIARAAGWLVIPPRFPVIVVFDGSTASVHVWSTPQLNGWPIFHANPALAAPSNPSIPNQISFFIYFFLFFFPFYFSKCLNFPLFQKRRYKPWIIFPYRNQNSCLFVRPYFLSSFKRLRLLDQAEGSHLISAYPTPFIISSFSCCWSEQGNITNFPFDSLFKNSGFRTLLVSGTYVVHIFRKLSDPTPSIGRQTHFGFCRSPDEKLLVLVLIVRLFLPLMASRLSRITFPPFRLHTNSRCARQKKTKKKHQSWQTKRKRVFY